jgi:hypothetical protein
VTTPKNFADVFRHRRPSVRRGLRNGQKDGLKIIGRPKAVRRNRSKKLPLRSALLRDSKRLQSPVRHDAQHIGRSVLPPGGRAGHSGRSGAGPPAAALVERPFSRTWIRIHLHGSIFTVLVRMQRPSLNKTKVFQ